MYSHFLQPSHPQPVGSTITPMWQVRKLEAQRLTKSPKSSLARTESIRLKFPGYTQHVHVYVVQPQGFRHFQAPRFATLELAAPVGPSLGVARRAVSPAPRHSSSDSTSGVQFLVVLSFLLKYSGAASYSHSASTTQRSRM